MNQTTGYCLGCYRTIEEIASWSTLSEEEQLAIHAQLDSRKAKPTGKSITTTS